MDGQDLKDFPLGWRFVEVGRNPPPGPAMGRIHPLREPESRTLWEAMVSREGDHLMTARDIDLQRDVVVVTHDDGWGERGPEGETKALLRDSFRWRDDTPVIVFWHAEVSTVTRWSVLVEYWSTFFYPSDDSGVVACLDDPTNLYWIEGHVFAHRRSQLSEKVDTATRD